MTRILRKTTGWIFALLAVAASLFILPEPSHAQVVCSTAGAGDADADGFTDAQECAPFALVDGTTIPPCVGTEVGSARHACLNPNSKDVFVILVKANPSLFDSYLNGQDPLAILKGVGAVTLRMGVHAINPTQVSGDRIVNAVTGQKAIRVSESLDANDVITGICNQGTPNGLDGCIVYTQRIANFVLSKCPAGKPCLINPSTGTQDANTVIVKYIQNTVAHEASHSMALTSTYNSRYGGNHYQTGTNVVMDQSVYYKATQSSTTFTIPGVYATADPTAARLK